MCDIGIFFSHFYSVCSDKIFVFFTLELLECYFGYYIIQFSGLLTYLMCYDMLTVLCVFCPSMCYGYMDSPILFSSSQCYACVG